MSETEPGPEPLVAAIAAEPGGDPSGYEYRVLNLPRWVSRAEARRLLAEHAEYGHWELARVRLRMGGGRQVWLRRKIIRVVRTA